MLMQVRRRLGVRRGPPADNTGDNIQPSQSLKCVPKTFDLGDLAAAERIHTGPIWLRALWTLWSVEVRVLFGALGEAPQTRGFSVL
jgi:hypothetical protein